jgi:ribose 5-phosphate isomerase B
MSITNIFVASDHSGIELKAKIISYIKSLNKFSVTNCGPNTSESVDYPDFARIVCNNVVQDLSNNFGILICGTGFGMELAANKFKSIRAVNIVNVDMASLAIQHNNINVLTLSARFVDAGTNIKIIEKVLNSSFEGGRHINRINKICDIENGK